MQHYQRQGQFEKAVRDAGLYLVKTAATTFFAYTEENARGRLMGHYSDEMRGTVAETDYEGKCMECEICHPRYI